MINIAMPININTLSPKSSLKRCQNLHKLSREETNILSFHNINGKPIFSTHKLSSKFRLAGGANGGINEEKSVIDLPENLKSELMPKHVAVIMDGHGRWAKKRGVAIEEGHRAGLDNMKQIVINCSKYGIKVLTVFGFSTENWSRSKVEVDFFMAAYEDFIQSFIKKLIIRKEVRFSMIGDKLRLPQSLQNAISSAEESSKDNKGIHFVMAVSYSGRYDITEATKKIATKVENGIISAKDINQSLFEQELMTNLMEHPNPDLLIRTSGELRISNFLLWQLAYSEFYFADKMFPDFQEVDFVEALKSFQGRKRRFGGRKN